MAPKEKKGHKANTKYDITVDSVDAAVSGNVLGKLATCLLQKGFCVVNFGIRQELLSGAVKEISRIEASGSHRLQPPPVEVSDALLGEEGSSLICELEVDPEAPLDGPSLQEVDAHLAGVADLAQRLQGDLGVGLQSRSKTLVHIAGYPLDDAPKLNDGECHKWMTELGKHRVMLIFILGPSGGMLELAPFADEDASPVEILLDPGATVLLRADTLAHKYAATTKSLALTCWLGQESGLVGRRVGPPVMSPTWRELDEWKARRLLDLKSKQVIGDEGQEWDPMVPREWQSAANHMFLTGPQVGMRSLSCKFPSTYDPVAFWSATINGVDLISEVPLMRWNHDDIYHDHPQGWKFHKSNCRHGGFAEGLDLFDSKFFNISPFEAKGMDPGQRHVLETSYEALLAAALPKKSLMRSLIGVYIAAQSSEFSFVPQEAGVGATSGANSITSNRISYALGMQGPSYTIDNQGAGSLSALTAATNSLRMQTDRFKPNHTCLVGGVFLQLAAVGYVVSSSQGLLSSHGRCLSFDESADGYVRSDGVSNCVISPVSNTVDGEDVMEEGKPLLGIVAGTAMLHTGRGASLTSPSGPQDSAVVFEAVKQASIGVTDMNAVACWGQGRLLEDAVEAQALSSSLRGDTENFEVPLVIASGMTQFGNAQDTVGMASLIRMLIGQRYGVMSPGLHLGTLSPHIDTWSGGQPLLINSEVIAYPGNTTYHGLTGKSLSGVLVHVVMFADLLPQLVPQPAAEEKVDLQIAFWPGGGGSLPDDAEPITGRPYSVMGSWSEWSVTEPMTSEGKGVYKLLVTLGPNRFEQFQVVLDSRKDSVLHPAWPEAGSGSAVHGPSPVEDVQHLRWTIDGRSPADALLDGGASGQDCALPGASFRVTLRVSGKWRSVEWEKVADPDPSSARQVDEGRYYVVGDFNDWTFQDELRLMDDGIYTAEVGPFPIGSGDFQIVRNQDWHQTFCPADQEDWEGPSQVMGPAEGPEQCWQLWPLPGDRFAIEFCRATDASGLDQRSISWQRARRRPLLGGE